MKREQNEKESTTEKEGQENRRKQEKARKRGQNQRGHCFFFFFLPEPVAINPVQQLQCHFPSPVSAPGKSMPSLRFSF